MKRDIKKERIVELEKIQKSSQGKIFPAAKIFSAGNGILADYAVFPPQLAAFAGYVPDTVRFSICEAVNRVALTASHIEEGTQTGVSNNFPDSVHAFSGRLLIFSV